TSANGPSGNGSSHAPREENGARLSTWHRRITGIVFVTRSVTSTIPVTLRDGRSIIAVHGPTGRFPTGRSRRRLMARNNWGHAAVAITTVGLLFTTLGTAVLAQGIAGGVGG